MILNLVTTLVSLQLASLITCFRQSSRGRRERVCSARLRYLPNFLGSLVRDEVFRSPACINGLNPFSCAEREKLSLRVVFVFYSDSSQKFRCPFYCWKSFFFLIGGSLLNWFEWKQQMLNSKNWSALSVLNFFSRWCRTNKQTKNPKQVVLKLNPVPLLHKPKMAALQLSPSN